MGGGSGPGRGERPARRGPAQRWNDLSIRAAFVWYVAGYLVLGLIVAVIFASLLGALQGRLERDAYEVSGIYLYDPDRAALVQATPVAASSLGGTVFVEDARNDFATLDPAELSDERTSIEDVSGWADAVLLTLGTSAQSMLVVGERDDDPQTDDPTLAWLLRAGGTLTPEGLAVYDESARQAFLAWAQASRDAVGAIGNEQGLQSEWDEEGGRAGQNVTARAKALDVLSAAEQGALLVSPVGYYVHEEPTAAASAASATCGVLIFLMFPLWLGVFLMAAARRFYRRRMAPAIALLDGASARIAERDLDFTLSYDRSDEMGRLVESFETMRASLAASQRELWRTAEERRRLNAAFAHDLRTPLTVLKGKVEMLQARLVAREGDAGNGQVALDRASLEGSLASLAGQVERLERYVEAMGSLQRLEDRTPAPADVPVETLVRELGDLGQGLCRRAGKLFELVLAANPSSSEAPTTPQTGVQVPTAPNAGTPLRGGVAYVDLPMVLEVAENLVSNAVRYARNRVTARISVDAAGHEASATTSRTTDRARWCLVLSVEDDGPGFTSQALARASDAFFSENKGAEHFGLGLNIARLLCEKHGGSLEIGSSPTGGGRVTATFLPPEPRSRCPAS